MGVVIQWRAEKECYALSRRHLLQYRQTSNISYPLMGNEIVDHSDLVEAPPVGAAPTTSSFST